RGAWGAASRTSGRDGTTWRARPRPCRAAGEDGERGSQDVTICGRGDHVLDRPDFGWGQSVGRRVRTGRLIVKLTHVLPLSPGMEPARRQSQEPQERPQRHKRTGTIYSSQDPGLGASVRQTLVRQRESRGSKEGERQPKECGELLDASSERQDFL